MEKTIKLEEEIFCLKYELEVLSEILNKGHVERWVHNRVNPKVEIEHQKRYDFVIPQIEGKTVLDIAGGSGYGTYLMAKHGNPEKISSIDIDQEAIKYAEIKYKHEKITREVFDAEKFISNKKFDVIVSFETIEHLNEPELFLRNMKESLKEGGTIVVSTPIAKETTSSNINKYHTIEWSFQDFQKLVSKYFIIKKVYVQSVILKSDLHDPIYKRVLRKLFFQNYVERHKPVFEEFTDQYDVNKIVSGYQILECCNL